MDMSRARRPHRACACANRGTARAGPGGRLTPPVASGARYEGLRLESSALAAVLVAAAALAQAPAQPAAQPPQPTFRTEANYVRVDAYPTTGRCAGDRTSPRPTSRSSRAARRRPSSSSSASSSAPPGRRTRRWSRTRSASRARWRSSRARGCSCCFSIPTTSTSAPRTRSGSRSSTRSIALIGQDDLVAVMTPEMSAADITFARRTTTIEGSCRGTGTGASATGIAADPEDQEYAECYPNVPESGLGPSARTRTVSPRR